MKCTTPTHTGVRLNDRRCIAVGLVRRGRRRVRCVAVVVVRVTVVGDRRDHGLVDNTTLNARISRRQASCLQQHTPSLVTLPMCDSRFMSNLIYN